MREFFQNMPRLLLVFVIMLGVTLLWYIWTLISNNLNERNTIEQQFSRAETIEVATSNATILADELTITPAFTSDSQHVLALTESGDTFTSINVKSSERRELFTTPIFQPFDFVRWSPSGEYAIVHRRANLNNEGRTTLYRFTDGTTADLNPNIFDLVWSPDGQAIYYMFAVGNGTFRLVKANPDGNDWRILLDNLHLNAPRLSLSHNGSELLIWPDSRLEGDELTEASRNTPVIYFTGTESREDLPVLEGALNPIWSPDDRRLAYLRPSTDGDIGSLWIFDRETVKETKLDHLTSLNQYAWQSNAEIAAVGYENDQTDPTNLKLSGIWQVGDQATPEKIVDINPLGIRTLHISPDGSILLLEQLGSLLAIPLIAS